MYTILHCRLHSLHVLIHIGLLEDVHNGSLEVEVLDILLLLIMHLGNTWLIKNILCVSGKGLPKCIKAIGKISACVDNLLCSFAFFVGYLGLLFAIF